MALRMRLCTAEELLNNEAKQTGCDLDLERVWSGSYDGCPSGYGISLGGATFEGVEQHEPMCSLKSTKLDVRCCADAFDVLPNMCGLGECEASVPGNRYSFAACCFCAGRRAAHSFFLLRVSCVNDGNMYACQCGATGYSSGTDSMFCIPPYNPCRSQPCGGIEGNRCVDNRDDTYYCECKAFGYRASGDYGSCEEIEDACVAKGDPCASIGDWRNECLDKRDGTVRCTCGGANYYSSADEQSCRRFEDQCHSSNACHTRENPANQCVLKGDDNWTCYCGGQRWKPSGDNKSCFYVANVCESK